MHTYTPQSKINVYSLSMHLIKDDSSHLNVMVRRLVQAVVKVLITKNIANQLIMYFTISFAFPNVSVSIYRKFLFKEIQPVHPKGDQSWVFIGGADVEATAPILWPPDAKS